MADPKDPCDDTVMLRLITVLREESALSYKGPQAIASVVKDTTWWRVLLAVPRDDKQFYYVIPVDPSLKEMGPKPDGSFVWGLIQLGSTVWEVHPSVHLPGQLHAYVTLIGVPSPAPWDPTWWKRP
jgi:hypothetical protein